MRASIFLLPLLCAGCLAPAANAPSLQPRAAEQIDPRVPIPDESEIGTANAALVGRLGQLVAQAEAGDDSFRPAAEQAQRLAAAAGGRESESWVVAQQALSAAVSARGPVTRASADIDSLAAERAQSGGWIEPADRKAIEAAAGRVAAIDSREAATIDAIQRQLGR